MTSDVVSLLVGFLGGLVTSAAFVVALIVGFCVALGVAKLKRTSGRDLVIKSLDERIERRPVAYLPPTAPRGPADQLRSPELLEAKA